MQRVSRSTAVAVMPSPPAGGTPGFFAKPNPGGGTEATVPGYEWHNWIQEEIVSVVLAAGIALDGTKVDQLLSALRSGGLFQTAAQFDTSAKVATMAALQRALGNFSAVNYVTGNATLSATLSGWLSAINGSTTYTQTLPLLSTVPEGACFPFENNGSVGQTVAAGGADTISAGANASFSTITVGSGEFAQFVKTGSTWRLSGSASLKYEAQFASSLSSNWFQKLPGGLLLNWGRVTVGASSSLGVTFPQAFPTACHGILFGRYNIGGGYTLGPTSITAAGFTANNQDGTSVTDTWLALGN